MSCKLPTTEPRSPRVPNYIRTDRVGAGMRTSILLIAAGVALFVFPEPATSGLGLALILLGVAVHYF